MSRLSRYNIGAGNHQKAREFFRLSCKVTAAISLACLLAMVCFPRELASLFLQENSAEVLEMTVTALRLYAPAYLFLWLNMVISSFLTAMDRAKDSLTIMLFRALIFPSLSLAMSTPKVMLTDVARAAKRMSSRR